MKPESIKHWFSAQELADMRLPGLPTARRKINERAAEERWALASDEEGQPLARPRVGRGGGLEYHFSLLPVATRAALVKRGFALDAVRMLATPKSSLWAAYERLPATAKAEAERRAAAMAKIDGFEAMGLTRSAAIGAAASQTGVSTATLWNWRQMIDGAPASDRLPLLAPRRSGGGKAADCDPEVWSLFLSDYLRPEKPTLTSCYYRVKEFAEVNGLAIPTERTLRRKIEQMDGRMVIARREGAEALRRTLPPTKRSVAHLHALELVNIDGHKFDVFVKLPTGEVLRPIMVGIQDIYSRKILAWRIGCGETAHMTQLVFADLFANFGIPKECYLDNGRAFASKMITGGAKNRFRFKVKAEEPTGLLTSLGIKIHWTLPYRGQSKPIERAWRDLCDTIAKHPALAGCYTGNKPDAKPENYGEKAVPIEHFKRVVERGIAAHNARTGRRTETANGRSFDQVFVESYAVAPIGKATQEQLRMALLAGEQVSADRKDGSISLMGNRYWSPELSAVAGKRVIVRFDPDNLHQDLHVYGQDGRYIGAAALWAATGFNDMDSAKARAKQEADLRRAVKRQIELEQLLDADDIARRLPDHIDEVELPEPGAIRPVRHRGQTAAALKTLSQAAEKPAETPFIDRFTTAFGQLRVVD